MELSGNFLLDVPSHMVWNALQDPEVLKAVLPGVREFEKVGEDEYTGTLFIKVGPVDGVFQGQIKLSDFKAPTSYWLKVEGKGAPGVLNASGRINLEARGNRTNLTYKGQVDIGGRIASVGQRLLDTSARTIIRQSLEALNEYLKAIHAGETKEEAARSTNEMLAASNPANPSRATGEHKPSVVAGTGSLFKDLIPDRYHLLLLIAIIVVVAVLILMTRR